ncbi:polysaccharide deacetylase [Chelatococcus daeguensis]|uniref:Chitooligosaccharide deacetylase n=1 Tax=Chelatococcus daeguensis TaxID=444444 RepID=A0AAC9NYT4_9HYPH|nr:polysaccharide deacetylase family protein [Chelatococcus daeguensis]APF37325.1 polysaccharide deacetylase [Chelatococcus daeguensis]
MNLRSTIIRFGMQAISLTGADRWLASAARGRGAILMLHHVRPDAGRGFAPNALLEVTPGFLDEVLTLAKAEGFVFVPLDEVPERLADPRPGAAPFLALTFDDGYRDNVVHAQPVLERHGAPWTVFVTTGFADRTARLWWLELEEAVRRLDHVAVDDGDLAIAHPARTDTEKSAAFEQLYWALRRGPEERLLAVIAGLAERAGVDGRALVEELCLDWAEIAALARVPGVTIGAHTLTHPMLAKHDAARARDEIERSRAIIAERVGQPVRHFAYPVGDPTSAGPREFAITREAGFATAVTTRPGHLFVAHAQHLTALPRVSLNGLYQTRAAARALLSGVPFLLWNRGRKLDVA